MPELAKLSFHESSLFHQFCLLFIGSLSLTEQVFKKRKYKSPYGYYYCFTAYTESEVKTIKLF